MKTSVVMNRKMGSFDVTQRTNDGMFNATFLLKQWNEFTKSKKEIKEFFENKATKEFLEILETDVSLHGGKSTYVKSRASRGLNAGTWMHPFLFIDFAMWINPKFKLEVIRFVYDELIMSRHNAGDKYIGLGKSLSMFNNVNYSQVAKGLNYIVFGKHEADLRQTATENQLKELTELQQKLAFAIDMNYIRTFDELLNEMRKMYFMKNQKLIG